MFRLFKKKKKKEGEIDPLVLRLSFEVQRLNSQIAYWQTRCNSTEQSAWQNSFHVEFVLGDRVSGWVWQETGTGVEVLLPLITGSPFKLSTGMNQYKDVVVERFDGLRKCNDGSLLLSFYIKEYSIEKQ